MKVIKWSSGQVVKLEPGTAVPGSNEAAQVPGTIPRPLLAARRLSAPPSTPSRATPQRGAVVLFALLVTSTVVAAASGLGSLVLGSLQQARAIDNSIIAYYAAETAIEEGLYQVRRLDRLPSGQAEPIAQENGASWLRDVEDRESVVYAAIPQDQLIEIALFDPSADLSETDIEQVEVRWSDDCGGCSALTALMVGWTPGGSLAWEPDTDTRQFSFTGAPAVLSLGPPNKLYRLRLRAKNADIKDVQVRAYGAGGAAADIPGRVRIDARGQFGGVEQRLTATMPRRIPLAGLYDFVIFSECSLVKGGGPVTCPAE